MSLHYHHFLCVKVHAHTHTHALSHTHTHTNTAGCQSSTLLHLSLVSLPNPPLLQLCIHHRERLLDSQHALPHWHPCTQTWELKTCWKKLTASGFKETKINIYSTVKCFPHFGTCEEEGNRRVSLLWHKSFCSTQVTWQKHAPTVTPEDLSHNDNGNNNNSSDVTW